MSDNILFEMQVEIMKRLPAKSLAVSRSVSKAWKSVIDSPTFITDYSNLHQHHRILLRYITFPDGKFKCCVKYVIIMDNDSFPQHDTVDNVPVSFNKVNCLDLVGTSRGLVCLFGNNSRENDRCKEAALICNPSLGKSIAIDVPCPRDLFPTVLGFGVRPDNSDPVIVKINHVEHPYPVMVFTLRSRVWRVPRGNEPPESIHLICSSVVVTDDRCIYWKTFGCGVNGVVAFDMMSEDFMEINLPHSVAHQSYEDFSISKIKESLALLEYCDDAEKPVYGVWMMVEDGVSNSFTKLFTINIPDVFVIKVLGFRKNDQPIMGKMIDEYGVPESLEVYEPRTGTIKELEISGIYDSFFLASYIETLLLLDQVDGQFVKIQLQLPPPKSKRFKRINAKAH